MLPERKSTVRVGVVTIIEAIRKLSRSAVGYFSGMAQKRKDDIASLSLAMTNQRIALGKTANRLYPLPVGWFLTRYNTFPISTSLINSLPTWIRFFRTPSSTKPAVVNMPRECLLVVKMFASSFLNPFSTAQATA